MRYRVRHTLIAVDLLLIPLALAGLVAAAAVFRAGELRCTRARAGEVPACSASELWLLSTRASKFVLSRASMRAQESDDASVYFVTLGNYEFRTGITEGSAKAIVSEATAFMNNAQALEWERTYYEVGFALFMLLTGLAVAAVVLFIPRWSVVHVEQRTVSVTTRSVVIPGVLRSHSLEGVEAARLEDIDDSAYVSLVLVPRGAIMQGPSEQLQPLVRAINDALAGTFMDGASMPDSLRDELKAASAEIGTGKNSGTVFAGWNGLGAKERWDRMEQFMRALPIEEARIVRMENNRRIEVRGKKNGLPLRGVVDPEYPGGHEMTLKARSPLGFMDMEFDESVSASGEAQRDPEWDDERNVRTFFAPHVYAEDAAAAEAFGALPAALREKICAVMTAERVRYFRVRPEEINCYLWDAVIERRDPVSHLSAVIALMGEVGAYVNTLPPKDEEA